MFKRSLLIVALTGSASWMVGSVTAAPAQAQDLRCMVPPFSGAMQPHGAVAQMRVINDGKACGVSHFGVPSERRNPAESAKVTRPAAHGTVRFVAPRVLYTPQPGYVGEDEFAYETRAVNNQEQEVVLRVKMKVIVLPAHT